MTDQNNASRLYAVVGILCAAMLGLGSRLAFLHLGPHEALRESIRNSRTKRTEILYRRGRILDRRGNLLGLDIAGKHICADPAYVVANSDPRVVAAGVAKGLHLDSQWALQRVSRPNSRFAYLRRFVPDEAAKAVREMELPGVFFRDTFVRQYPKGPFLCHVLGFCNYEGVGSGGIEQRMDRYLRGSPGLRVAEKDGRQRELPGRRIEDKASRDGADVCLNVDEAVQYVVERALDEAVAAHKAKAAWAIVQDVLTGEILAMCSRPAYDPNTFRQAQEAELCNRAVSYTYDPGSTLKVVTIASALDKGSVQPTSVFDCENGAWFYGGWPLRDHHPYGTLTVADGLKKSSNILTAKVALTLGDACFERYLRAFGFGSCLGIDLPGEETGILRPSKSWSKVAPTRLAIGQGVTVTALQMLGAVCAIGNEGFLMRPYITRRVTDSRGGTLLQPEPLVLGRPIKRETAALMTKLLARVTEEGGTGTKACVPGYRVAGKTGTAQKVINGQYSSSAFVASFVGFLPADEPQIGVIVVVDEPRPLHTGGAVAAPVFRGIAEQAVRYLDIAPARYAAK
ncbi:MAG: penicillin-binding protein 2 [Kiritimatiellae bacterium]|nr:penicillin-binding protein 2 [Kiritimatiellia bacterium]